jgi:hypothetical protein
VNEPGARRPLSKLKEKAMGDTLNSTVADDAAEAKAKRGPKRKPHTGAPQPAFLELSQLMAVAVFAGGTLKYRSQAYPNGPWTSDWIAVGTGKYRAMGAGITRDGRVAVAAQNTNGSVDYIAEAADKSPTGPKPGGKGETVWAQPVNLGAPRGSLMQIALGRDGDGRVEIFGVDNDFNVWWIYENPDRMVDKTITVTPPGTTTPITITVQELAPPEKPWGDWVKLSGQLVGYMSLATNADGGIAVFGLTAPGKDPIGLAYNEQRQGTALTAEDWSGWTRLAPDAPLPLAWLATKLDDEGAINAFFVDATGQVGRIRQTPPASRTWSRTSRPGYMLSGFVNVAPGIDADGHFMLAATSDNGPIYINQQLNVAQAQWSGWMPIMPAQNVRVLTLDYNADGRLTLFRRDTMSNALTLTSQVAVNSTEWDAAWTQLAAKDVIVAAIVRDLTPSPVP